MKIPMTPAEKRKARSAAQARWRARQKANRELDARLGLPTAPTRPKMTGVLALPFRAWHDPILTHMHETWSEADYRSWVVDHELPPVSIEEADEWRART
jgi:hypothetical protein